MLVDSIMYFRAIYELFLSVTFYCHYWIIVFKLIYLYGSQTLKKKQKLKLAEYTVVKSMLLYL